MRRISPFLIAAAMVAMVLTPLAGGQVVPALAHSQKATTTVKVGLGIIDGINDKGFNSLADTGLNEAIKTYHVHSNVVVTPQNGNYVATLQAFVNDHDTLVIAVGALWGNALFTVASQNKHVHFAIVDGYPLNSKNKPQKLNNVVTLQFKTQQSGYIAGVVAGLMEKDKVGAATDNVIAALGAIPLPFIISQMCGYWQGALSVDKSVKFVAAYVPGSNPFFDPQDAQTIGERQIQTDHADILFGVADASGLGYYKAAADAGKYAIGFASDQDGLGSYMLTSAEVGIQVAVFRTIRASVEGQFKAGNHIYTIKNGGISYAKNMHHVPAAIKARAARVASELAGGKLVAKPSCNLSGPLSS